MRSRSAESLTEHLPHWGVLVILLVFTYARLFEIPYKGFDVSPQGEVLAVFVDGNPGNPLKVGDRLLQAGDLTWSEFRADFDAVLFKDLQPGQVVPIVVERDGVRKSIEWTYPGLNNLELVRYTWSTVWLSYLFWALGMMTAIHLRPKGEARTVAVAYCHAAALWLIFGGNFAFSHAWYAAYFYTFAYFLCVPLALHFHWIWPRPLTKLPSFIVWIAYGAALLLAVGVAFDLVPRAAFSAASLLVIVGVPGLLALHAVLQPDLRRSLRRLFLFVLIALLPVVMYPILKEHLGTSVAEMIGAIGVPLIPLGYIAPVRKRELGPLELRVNRVVTVYVFLALLALVIVPVTAIAALRLPGPGAVLLVGSLTAVIGAAMARQIYPRLQSFFDRHVLGIPVAANDLVRSFVSRVAAAPSIPRILALLTDEMLPSLLARQFLFLRLDQREPRILLAMGLSESMLPSSADIPGLLAHETGSKSSPSPGPLPAAFNWIRIILALRREDDLLGLWLFGRRDPDDQYSDHEVELIRSLADQTAVAISNLIQTERVRELYRANVRRTEEERLQLAHALHDRVLNQLAALLMRLDDPSITPAVLASFEEFSDRVRAIVADLRPPMLAYGLRPALAELVEALAERAPGGISLSLDIPECEARYTPEVELQLYRIAQESCENAVHHASPRKVTISGTLEPDHAEIEIQDDGAGFDLRGAEAIGRLIAQKHFGLAGMIERASLIGGTMRIQTAPGEGTRIKVFWSARRTGALPGSVSG